MCHTFQVNSTIQTIMNLYDEDFLTMNMRSRRRRSASETKTMNGELKRFFDLGNGLIQASKNFNLDVWADIFERIDLPSMDLGALNEMTDILEVDFLTNRYLKILVIHLKNNNCREFYLCVIIYLKSIFHL